MGTHALLNCAIMQCLCAMDMMLAGSRRDLRTERQRRVSCSVKTWLCMSINQIFSSKPLANKSSILHPDGTNPTVRLTEYAQLCKLGGATGDIDWIMTGNVQFHVVQRRLVRMFMHCHHPAIVNITCLASFEEPPLLVEVTYLKIAARRSLQHRCVECL